MIMLNLWNVTKLDPLILEMQGEISTLLWLLRNQHKSLQLRIWTTILTLRVLKNSNNSSSSTRMKHRKIFIKLKVLFKVIGELKLNISLNRIIRIRTVMHFKDFTIMANKERKNNLKEKNNYFKSRWKQTHSNQTGSLLKK